MPDQRRFSKDDGRLNFSNTQDERGKAGNTVQSAYTLLTGILMYANITSRDGQLFGGKVCKDRS